MHSKDGPQPTTLRIHLLNVKKFLSYLAYMPIQETKLSGVDFRRLQMEIQARLKDLASSVVTHRQKVRKDGSKHIVDKEDSKTFREEVPQDPSP